MEVFMLCTKIYISDTKKPMTIESTSGISESQHNAILDGLTNIMMTFLILTMEVRISIP